MGGQPLLAPSTSSDKVSSLIYNVEVVFITPNPSIATHSYHYYPIHIHCHGCTPIRP